MHAQAAVDPRAMSDAPRSEALPAGQLVRQATGGDIDDFEELIRRLQRRVYGFAFQHLRDRHEAHDLTQEIFVKLYRNLGRYDLERPFEPWFWKLAANTTINYRRKRVPLPAEPTEDAVDLSASLHAHDPTLVEALAQLDPATACRSSCTTTPTFHSSRSAGRSTSPSPPSSRASTERGPSSATPSPKPRSSRRRDDRHSLPRVRARARPHWNRMSTATSHATTPCSRWRSASISPVALTAVDSTTRPCRCPSGSKRSARRRRRCCRKARSPPSSCGTSPGWTGSARSPPVSSTICRASPVGLRVGFAAAGSPG